MAVRWRGPGGVARNVAIGVLLGAVTAYLDLASVVGPLALSGRSEGRYAVDIGRTVALYLGIGALYGTLFGLVFARFVASRPDVVVATTLAGRGYAIAAGIWIYFAAVAVRTVHGAALPGADPGPPGLLFHSSAAVLATTIGYALTKRHAAFPALPSRFRRALAIVAAGVAAAASIGLLIARELLDLDSLIAREIAAIPTGGEDLTKAATRTNLLLLTIDALRADRIGAYGYEQARTPTLDRLASEGVLFERAIAQSSWTRPSFGTLFTSRYPSDHQAAWRLLKNAPDDRRSPYNRPLRTDLPTAAEILDAGGYLTIAVNTNVQTSRPFGFHHGFDHFIDVSRPVSALTSSIACKTPWLGLSNPCAHWSAVSQDYPYLTGDRVLTIFRTLAGRLDRSPRPFFLWLHFMDTHVPYRSHDGSNEKLGYDDIERLVTNDGDPARAQRVVSRMYDAAVAFTDRCVGKILERVEDSPAFANTAVVVTSDHGEEILERWRAASDRPAGFHYYYRGYGHGHTMYDELLRVPLILRFPDRRHPGARPRFPVGHVDITPTLLALAGVTSENPRYRPEGIDLTARIESDGDLTRELRSEGTLYGAEVKALTVGRAKIVARLADGGRERYDLAKDPREREEFPAGDTATFAPLERNLDAWLASVPPEPGATTTSEPGGPSINDARLRQQLEALGYVR